MAQAYSVVAGIAVQPPPPDTGALSPCGPGASLGAGPSSVTSGICTGVVGPGLDVPLGGLLGVPGLLVRLPGASPGMPGEGPPGLPPGPTPRSPGPPPGKPPESPPGAPPEPKPPLPPMGGRPPSGTGGTNACPCTACGVFEATAESVPAGDLSLGTTFITTTMRTTTATTRDGRPQQSAQRMAGLVREVGTDGQRPFRPAAPPTTRHQIAVALLVRLAVAPDLPPAATGSLRTVVLPRHRLPPMFRGLPSLLEW